MNTRFTRPGRLAAVLGAASLLAALAGPGSRVTAYQAPPAPAALPAPAPGQAPPAPAALPAPAPGQAIPAPAPAPGQATPYAGQVAAAMPPGGGSNYSPRLGIYYTLVPYGSAFAARLMAPPAFGSPLNQPQIQLEAGDTITALDGLPIYSPADVENHYDQTSVTFINIRTGLIETRWTTLGSQIGPGPGPVGPMILGVTGVTTALPIPGIGGPAGYPGFQITSVVPGSAAQAAGLYPGEIISSINNYRVYDMNTLRAAVNASGGVCRVSTYSPYGIPRTVIAYVGGTVGYGAPAAAPVAAPAAAPAGAPAAPVTPGEIPGIPSPAAPAVGTPAPVASPPPGTPSPVESPPPA